MSMLSKLFGGGGNSNPADKANKYLDQIPGIGHQYLDPYVNQGQDSSKQLQDLFQSLMSNPGEFLSKMQAGYEPSEGYQFQKNLLTKEMGNTAAAGGIAGTPLDQMNQAEGIHGLLSKDMQEYLSNVLGIFGQGVTGEQDIANKGFDASKGAADYFGNALNQKGGLAFQGQQQKNADKSAMIQNLIKALGTIGGGAMGGPIGAGIANWAFPGAPKTA